MIDTVIFSSPILIALVALPCLLHIASGVCAAIGLSKSTLTYVFIGVNVLSHIALFVTALVLGTKADELFLAVMISAAVGMLSVYISERIAANRATRGRENKEDSHGI